MFFPKVFGLLLSFLFIGLTPLAYAHEVNPPVINIELNPKSAKLDITFNAEIFLADIDASKTANTNDSEKAEDYDRLRALNADEIKQRIQDRQAELLALITLQSEAQNITLTLGDIETENDDYLELPRQTRVHISADLPAGDDDVTVRLAPTMGAYIIRQKAPFMDEDDLYADFIAAGLETLPIPRQEMVERNWQETFVQYVISGIAHIIPKGLDHIVFIMGLYFFSPHIRPLLMQVTVFTLAHSFTLALATLKLVFIPASVVEPLIALSIVWIGVENILRPKIGLGRMTVIFIFGLLHGLGFAFVLGEVGLAGSAFAISLIAFNIGVEFGQLMVLAPLVIMGLFISKHKAYRQRVENPASFIIAMIGLYWFLERVIG